VTSSTTARRTGTHPRVGRRRYSLVRLGSGALLALSLIGVASGAGSAVAADVATYQASSSVPSAYAPAASGKITSISGKTLEVLSEENGQTTVDLTPKTAITATVTVRLGAVKAGTCITATGTKGKNGEVNATSIMIEPSTKGNCGLARFAGSGFPGSGASGHFSFPTGSKPKTKFVRPANLATATGKVISVSGTTITVAAITFSGKTTGSAHAKAKNAARKAVSKHRKTVTKVSVKVTTSRKTVKVSTSTKYLKTEAGTASALRVGECATAFGSTNDIGAVTATRLSVSPATAAGCAGGFGGFGGFGADAVEAAA